MHLIEHHGGHGKTVPVTPKGICIESVQKYTFSNADKSFCKLLLFVYKLIKTIYGDRNTVVTLMLF